MNGTLEEVCEVAVKRRQREQYANPGPTLIVGLQYRASMSARAVAVIRPAPNIISLPVFLCILSGKRQLHAYQYLFEPTACRE
jgi:hypothetical protein